MYTKKYKIGYPSYSMGGSSNKDLWMQLLQGYSDHMSSIAGVGSLLGQSASQGGAEALMSTMGNTGGDASGMASALGKGAMSAMGGDAGSSGASSALAGLMGGSGGGDMLGGLMGGAGGGMLGGLTGGASGLAQSAMGLLDDNAKNDGTAIGGGVGSALDMTAAAFGIPTFGGFQTLGSMIGTEFNNPGKDTVYKPSGNTAGNWRDFKKGGSTILPRYKTYYKTYQQGGFYGTAPKSRKDPTKDSIYQFYLEPEKQAHLAALNKKYKLPPGTLEAITMKESASADYIKDPRTGKTVPVRRPKSNTTSSANAQGPFQFQPATGREYGLETEADRRDFFKAAEAAAKKLSKDLKTFGSMEGALMAYNWGSTNTRRHYAGDKKKQRIPSETKDYINAHNEYKEKLVGYNTYLPDSSIPTVTAPRSLSPFEKELGRPVDYPQTEKASMMKRQIPFVTDPIDFTNPTQMQEGGNVNAPSIEIEGGEYVFNPQGLDENNFRMLDNTGKKHMSDVGFIAQGKDHAKDNSAGIKVAEGDAYIASKYLGMDGKKASKKNPSVASMMLKNGGTALGKGFQRKWDRFAINDFNPAAVKHHVRMMNNVKNTAELNKTKEKIRENVNDYQKFDNQFKQMQKGGLISSTATLQPSPMSYWNKIDAGNKASENRRSELRSRYMASQSHYNNAPVVQYKKGGNTDDNNLDAMSFGDAFAASRKAGADVFTWRGRKFTTETKSEDKKAPVKKAPAPAPAANVTYTAEGPEVMVTAKRPLAISPEQFLGQYANIPKVEQQPIPNTLQPYQPNYFELDIDKYKYPFKAVKLDETRDPISSEKKYMILHQTGARVPENVQARWVDDDRYPNGGYYTGAHYYIRKDGSIVQPANESYIVNHAGKARIGNDYNLNELAVGIEFESLPIEEENRKHEDDHYEPLSDKQMEAGSKLVANWIMKQGLSPDEAMKRVFGHNETTSYGRKGSFEGPVENWIDPLNPNARKTYKFGEKRKLWSQARKVDINTATRQEIMKMVMERLKEAGYYDRFNNNNRKRKLGGFSDYEKYYNALTPRLKAHVKNKLKKIPKAQMGGALRDMLDDMYAQESLVSVNGSEGL